MSLKKLNLGCGTDFKDGWVNLDSAAISGVDVVHNVETLPLPFEDNSFEEILAQDILEHIEYVPVLRDLHRILAPGGKIHIRVPHFTSKNNFIDPTHKRQFSVSTWDFFVKGTRKFEQRAYYFDFAFDFIESRTMTFEKSSRALFYNKFFERFINKDIGRQRYFESSFLRGLFPAENILVTLVK